MSTEQNKAVVRRFITETLDGGNVDVIDELFAPNYVNHAMWGMDVAAGPVDALVDAIGPPREPVLGSGTRLDELRVAGARGIEPVGPTTRIVLPEWIAKALRGVA